jgi:hypothetical protein
MKTKVIAMTVFALLPLLVFCQSDKDFGDAPESVLAYPGTGALGGFPTCITVGPSGFVSHTNFGAYFLAVDFEPDGNGGLCPGFNPYDNDECFADGDAGLILPQPFTIVNNMVTVCPGSMGNSMGPTCQLLYWGNNLDIDVTNFMPSQTIGWVNVLVDWNQNGFWGDSVTCPQGTVYEHALFNFPIPNPYSGPISALMPPPITSGPNDGFYWARFSITEQQVYRNWDGHGTFEDGESEDYLLYCGSYDFGDAPEGSLAYPLTGVIGQFPTCINVGAPNTYVQHFYQGSYFGPSWDGETEGNASVCPVFTPNSYDQDECYQDADAGLIIPMAYTITGPVGSEQVVPCQLMGPSLGIICQVLNWGTDIDINVTGNGYVNVLIDWDQDGIWAYNTSTVCGTNVVKEHVLQNFFVSTGVSVPLSTLAPPSFQAGPYHGYVWARFTISDQMVVPNYDGSGMFYDGETEDYLIELTDSASVIHKVPQEGMIPLKLNPNPVTDQTTVEFILPRKGNVKIEVTDLGGKIVGVLPERNLAAGKQAIGICGESFSVQALNGGIYVVRLIVDGRPSGLAKAVVIR